LRLAAGAVPVEQSCNALGVSQSGDYEARGRAPSCSTPTPEARSSIDSRQHADLAMASRGMAIESRGQLQGQKDSEGYRMPGTIIHGDHGTQFTS